MFNIEKIYDELPWLSDHQRRLSDSIAAGNLPHSLIIQGPRGMGRRQLALWLAGRVLGAEPVRALPDGGYEAVHPDFRAIAAPYVDTKGKERKTLGVDVIRERLIPFLALTSHGTGARVLVVFPADALTVNAANSLLKTLEEPPAGALIVLVCETLARLPATVTSRCQQVRLGPPDTAMALAWLEQQAPGQRFERLLEFAGGAPLAALQLYHEDFPSFANAFLSAVGQLEAGTANPMAVAADCRNQEALALQLLEWRIAERIREAVGRAERQPEMLDAGFRQLGEIRELRRVINGGINAELGLAGLLLDWYGGFGRRQNRAK